MSFSPTDFHGAIEESSIQLTVKDKVKVVTRDLRCCALRR